MKDEIIEKIKAYYVANDIDEVLDCITNSQEENIHLDKVNCQLRKKINNDIYKSRNEKAIKYIKKLSNKPNVFGHYAIDGNCKKYLLNILQGSDKDE